MLMFTSTVYIETVCAKSILTSTVSNGKEVCDVCQVNFSSVWVQIPSPEYCDPVVKHPHLVLLLCVLNTKRMSPPMTWCVCLCVARRGLPSVPACLRGGEAPGWGAAAERGEEHPEERREPTTGSAAAAARTDTRGSAAEVRGHHHPQTHIYIWSSSD